MGLRREKLSHLRFYFHDIMSGRNSTAVRAAQAAATNSSATLFGMVIVMDDPLTAGPTISSKIIGRAQGMYGKFNGSTLTVVGRNPPFTVVRELPVVGGSGVFRFARGYAQAKSHDLNLKTGDAVME